MAIINCPECGKKVSTRAEECPHCGFPIKSAHNLTTPVYGTNGSNSLFRILLIVIASCAIITTVVFFISLSKPSTVGENNDVLTVQDTAVVVEETPRFSLQQLEQIEQNRRQIAEMEEQARMAEEEYRIEQQREAERKAKDAISWIQGRWICKATIYGGPYPIQYTTVLIINSDYIKCYMNGELEYSGSYYIDGDVLHYGENYVTLDRRYHRLDGGEGLYFRKTY